MNITMTFVEYDAVNSIRGLTPAAFTLVSTAKLSHDGDRRMWIVDGDSTSFEELRRVLDLAMARFLRSSVAASLTNVGKTIDAAVRVAKQSAPVAAV